MTEPRTHTLKPNVAGVLGRLQTTTNLPVDLRLGRWPTTADDEGFWILAGFLGTESLLAIFRDTPAGSPNAPPSNAPKACAGPLRNSG
jgi:hypothetical protein